MNLVIVDRKYLIGGKWFRLRLVKGIVFIIAIGRYEFRFYKKNKKNEKLNKL